MSEQPTGDWIRSLFPFAVMCFGMFMALLDIQIVASSLQHCRRHLPSPTASISGSAACRRATGRCSGCSTTSRSATACSSASCPKPRTELARYIYDVATVSGGRVSARSWAGHVLRQRFKAQLIKPTWL
jgi:hypothetical protein